MTSLPVAAIDCGTNTIKLLITDGERDLVRETRMVRLGEGVDRTGRLSDAALSRAFAAIDEYADLIRAHRVATERIRFCATSATRDSSNADDFARGVRQRLGVAPEVLAGTEEAALAFAGAAAHLKAPTSGPLLVVDIGGGSTELILGLRGVTEAPGAPVTAARSLDIGSVRLHERHLHSDPPSAAEMAACRADIRAALDTASEVEVASADTVVGVAGTVLTVVAGVLDLPAYDRALTDQAVVGVSEVREYVASLLAMSVAERMDLAYMEPGRADVIGAGALILDEVLTRTGVARLTSSEADILDGIAASLVG